MHRLVILDIEDGEQNQARGADDGAHGRQCAEDFLSFVVVLSQAAFVPQPTFGDEGDVERDHGDGATGDEQRSTPCCGSDV